MLPFSSQTHLFPLGHSLKKKNHHNTKEQEKPPASLILFINVYQLFFLFSANHILAIPHPVLQFSSRRAYASQD